MAAASRACGRRHGSAFAALLVLILALALACRPGGDSPALRVMTWNIAAGGGDIGRIVETIRTVDADIVGLQEVDVHWGERSRFVDQARLLADSLGMHVRFGPIYRIATSDSTPPREFGVAILSRPLIVASENHVISRLSTQTPDSVARPMPGFLEVVVHLDGRRVRIFDTHLDYRADPRVRERQVGQMLTIIAADSAPALLLGDLNAPPDAPELQPLFAALDDAWRAATGPGFTYPASAPSRRIDYVLTSRHFRVTQARTGGSGASDHLPVIVELLLAPGHR